MAQTEPLRVLILTPPRGLSSEPGSGGGVANYLALLRTTLPDTVAADVMEIGRRGTEGSLLATFRRLVVDAARLLYRVVGGRYDVVHLNPSFNANSVPRDAIHLAILRLVGVRGIVVFFRGWDAGFAARVAASRPARWLGRRLLAHPAQIVVLSRRFVPLIARLGVSVDRVTVETTSFDGSTLEAALPAARPAAERTDILFMSRLIRAKGPFELLTAFARIAERHPDLRLVFAGTGPERKPLESEAKRLGLAGRVRFPGYLTGAAKAEALISARVFALPTRHPEGMPNALLEAMAAGAAVLTTDVGGIAEVAADGVHGRVLARADADSVAEALADLLNEPERLTFIGSACQFQAWQRFDSRLVADRIASLYHKAAHGSAEQPMPKPVEAPLPDFLRPVRARRARFLGVPIDPIGMEETLALADRAMAERRCLQHVVVNVAKLVNLRRDPELALDVMESDIINVDGMGVVWGARLLGLDVPERVAGIDLFERLLELSARRGYRPYLLGAKREVLDKAVANIRRRHPDLILAGWRDGYFTPADEHDIVRDIRESGADCLFVAISSPTKERFTRRYRNELGVSFLMGVGGSVDVVAGLTRRAPDWMQRAGLEWFYRLAQEPRRMWRRYLVTNTRYLLLLGRELLRGMGRVVRP